MKRIASFVKCAPVQPRPSCSAHPRPVGLVTCVLGVVVPSLLARWLLSFFISLFSILHPSIQQALIKHLMYTLFLLMSPGQGH